MTGLQVDEPTLTAIRQQFHTLTSHRSWRETEGRVLDAQMVFAELVDLSRVRQRPRGAAAGLSTFDQVSHEHIPLVNLKVRVVTAEGPQGAQALRTCAHSGGAGPRRSLMLLHPPRAIETISGLSARSSSAVVCVMVCTLINRTRPHRSRCHAPSLLPARTPAGARRRLPRMAAILLAGARGAALADGQAALV